MDGVFDLIVCAHYFENYSSERRIAFSKVYFTKLFLAEAYVSVRTLKKNAWHIMFAVCSFTGDKL